MERSPTGGGAGGAFGAAAAAPRLGSTFREGTPRRRSMTPSGSAMEPSGMLYPPGGSLFESPTGKRRGKRSGRANGSSRLERKGGRPGRPTDPQTRLLNPPELGLLDLSKPAGGVGRGGGADSKSRLSGARTKRAGRAVAGSGGPLSDLSSPLHSSAGGPAFGQSTQAGWAVAAPPPPPTHSLADELPGGGGGFGGAQPAAGGRSRFGPLPVSSPAGGGAAPSTASNPDDPTGCWVTAFGFAPADRALVLGELARCGDVRRFGSGRSGGSGASASSSSVNWVHVQFGTPAQAARARSLDGCLLAGRLLVGVKPLDSAGAADVARLVAVGSGADGDGEGGAGDAGGELRAAPPAMPVRPYRVDAGDQVRE